MKRYLLLLVSVMMMLALLIGCGNTSLDTNNSGTSADSTPSQTGSASNSVNMPTSTPSTSVTSTVPESSTASVTTLDTLSPTERQEFEEMVQTNIEKALVIGNKTIDTYGSYKVPMRGYSVSRYVNPFTGITKDTASVWHYTAYYAMVSRLIDITEGTDKLQDYIDLSEKVYEGFAWYSGTADVTTYLGTFSTTFYGVNRSLAKNGANVAGDQAVYDDQMWIIREMVYRYHQTNERQYLDEAIRLAQICIKGWDYSLDSNNKEYGGIPWGPFYSSKHTCSNAPIIAPLVEIYECLKELDDPSADYYLEWAEKIYTYTRTNLLDTNKLYADSIGYQRVEKTGSNGMKKYVSVGTTGFDGTKYTYNTGAMISGATALYRATGKASYLMDAKNSATAAYNVFRALKGKIPYYPNETETTWFNLVLFQGFIDLYEYDTKNVERYILSFQTSLDFAYENYLKDDGFLPRNYVDGWDETNTFDTNKNVMDQASASQIYAMLALWAENQLAEDNAKIEAALGS